MKVRSISLIAGILIAAMFISCESAEKEPEAPLLIRKGKEIDFNIKKVQKRWLVTKPQSNNPTKIEAARNDTIVWRAQGSEMQFQFPDTIGTYFTDLDSDTTGGKYFVNVKNGKTLRLKVKSAAPDTTLIYSVLVKKDCVFAEGSSPPVIIIR